MEKIWLKNLLGMKLLGEKYGKKYIAEQGNVVFLDFNQNTKMVIMCPITSNSKEFPTHYKLEDTKNVYESILCEHIRSLDYEFRNL